MGRVRGAGNYALVEWVTGRYKGTLTSNVNIEWIKDFDGSDVGSDESVVVEWRQPPMPKAGWPLFDAKVLEVSGKYSARNLPSCFMPSPLIALQCSTYTDFLSHRWTFNCLITSQIRGTRALLLFAGSLSTCSFCYQLI
jgi:hypothetical protein